VSAEVVEIGLLADLRRVQLDHERWLACEDVEYPPVAGRKYKAYGIWGDGSWRALAVGHMDADESILDVLKADITEDVAVPLLERYGVHPQVGGDQFGYPLAQALCGMIHELIKPPPPCPHYLSTWRHQLLFHQYQELGMILHAKWQACWKDGVQFRELPFDGVRFEELLSRAVEYHQHDELDRCEGVLAEAERVMLGRTP
jgi:hypothetical protein